MCIHQFEPLISLDKEVRIDKPPIGINWPSKEIPYVCGAVSNVLHRNDFYLLAYHYYHEVKCVFINFNHSSH